MTGVSITVLILVVAVAAFVWNRLPVEIVALGVALSLFGTGAGAQPLRQGTIGDRVGSPAELAAAVNAEARLRALQYLLLGLAGLALLAIVPAGGMPGRMRGDLPGQLEPDDPDALELDPADTTTQRRA